MGSLRDLLIRSNPNGRINKNRTAKIFDRVGYIRPNLDDRINKLGVKYEFGPSVFYLFGPPDSVYRTSSFWINNEEICLLNLLEANTESQKIGKPYW